MPKITYTTEKGLVQSTGSGSVGGVFMKPGYTAVAGSTLAIPLTHGVVNKTTGGAEALTLADGLPGQLLKIVLAGDGGDGTLTPSTSTGWATAVLADVKDSLTLLYVNDTVGWIVLGYSGTAAPPVLT